MCQTHVSWLFFTERFVYKVKKPVDFGFLDFTTLEARGFFYNEEVQLNRRLGATFCVLECWCPEDELRRRLQARAACGGAVSDGRWELIARPTSLRAGLRGAPAAASPSRYAQSAGARYRRGGAAARAPRPTASPIILPCRED